MYTVSITQGSRTVAQQREHGDDTVRYRFDVPEGRYRVRNSPGAATVIVRVGHVTHADLLEPCG